MHLSCSIHTYFRAQIFYLSCVFNFVAKNIKDQVAFVRAHHESLFNRVIGVAYYIYQLFSYSNTNT
ncbi:hypothetical protein BpHYR1_041581 [Brachionus plicatilis]|uniref:Uncharacterized protein n=1 Tax=Brachionus plicatilis TaxID=10195 RepID=A0A3M7SR55_BRAPC|nr:hypothetical protein BpHYR1_041581 [Brachionus plicatilis]